MVIRDSREQKELDISPLRYETACLKTGDFSVKGFEDKITIELKALDDFVGCVTFERERFERELERMKAYPYRLIVVKSSWSKIYMKHYRSSVPPNAVMGSAMSFQMTAPIVMAENHSMAGILVARFLWVAASRCHRQMQLERDVKT